MGTVTGSSGDDTLVGTPGDDSIAGLRGNDSLAGNGGSFDTLDGGTGNDTLNASGDNPFPGGTTFIGGAGNDSFIGGPGQDIVTYASSPSGVSVTKPTTGLDGSASDGFGGTDTFGDGVADVLIGSGFNDTLVGSPVHTAPWGEVFGDDQIYGGAGDDLIQGLSGDDELHGETGNDTLDGGDGNDELHGGAGNDSIIGGNGFDVATYGHATAGIVANLQTGVVTGGDGTDTLSGIEGISGSGFDDSISGSSGVDLMEGGGGSDTLDGGAGFDYVVYGNASGSVSVDLAAGTAAGAEGSDSLANFEGADGSNFADTLTGDANANFLFGDGGDDTLLGGSGDDTLAGGGGNDSIDGGSGANDLAIFSGNRADYVITYGPGGQVTLADTVAGRDGTDTLTGIESLQFAGQVVSASTLDNPPVFAPGTVFNGVATVGHFAIGASVSVAAQGDGKLLAVVGETPAGELDVFRLTANGLPDPTYGSGGVASFSLAGYTLGASGGGAFVATKSDGTSIVATSYTGPSSSGIIAVHFLADGSVDAGFNGGLGYSLVPVAPDEVLRCLTLDGSGRVLMTSWHLPASGLDTQVIRLNANGTLDNSFGTNGIASIPVSQFSDRGDWIVPRADGSIFVAGRANVGEVEVTVLKLTANGALDTSFNGTGTVLFMPPGFTQAAAHAMTVQGDGSMIVVGFGTTAANQQSGFVVRLHADGSVDTTFGTGGWVFPAPPGYVDQSDWRVIVGGGKILVFGDAVTPGGDFGSYVLRLNSNGTPDTSFGHGGYYTGLGTTSGEPLLLADGRILASDLAGNGTSIQQPAIVRLLADGTLDSSFNPGPGVPALHSAQPFTITAVDLLRGWSDPDAGDSIHVASVAVDHGTVQVQGTGEAAVYTITATNGYSGTLTLTYTVADTQGGSSTGTRTFAMQNAHPTGGVFLSGVAAQGQTLTASNTLADADGLGAISYQWLIDGSPVAGATGTTLAIGAAQAGHTITVVASYVDGFGTHESVSSKPVVAGAVVAGTAGDDSLVGTGGADVITALAGNDTIASGGGSDTIDGSDGIDTVRFSGSYGQYVIANGAAAGVVLVTGPDGGHSRLVGVENLQFSDRVLPLESGTQANDVLTVAATEGSVVVDGGDGNDVITANDSGNALLGGGGDDRLTGGAGGDNLDGGTGNDTMSGGLGDDVYVVDSAADVVVESSAPAAQATGKDHNPQDINLGGGIDKVVASVNYTLGSFVENLVLADGAGNLSGTGNALDNVISGNGGGNALSAAAGNDTITGGAGNDTIDGGDGRDTAFFSGNVNSYAITRTDAGITVSGPDGTDLLANVERAHFDDFDVAFDIDGDAGLAYRLYQAAFNRTPDIGGLGYQMHDLDIGVTLEQVAANFIASPEFQRTYGNVDDTQFLTLLYNNVLHRAPDAGGLAFHLDEFAHGQSRAVMLIHFSESPENQANVIGAIEDGMVYTY